MGTLINANQLSDKILTIDKINTTFSSFSANNYVSCKNILDFENANSLEFIIHLFTPPSTYSNSMFLFASIDTEGTGGGFDIAFTYAKKLYISQSAVDVTGWDFDNPISDALNLSTEYWFKMQFDGSTYSYIVATDKNFTNIISTVTNASGKKIKNSTANPRFGTCIRPGVTGYFGDGKIIMSDCKFKINDSIVFSGNRSNQYNIIGSPTIITTFF